jgi:hypothetical protein
MFPIIETFFKCGDLTKKQQKVKASAPTPTKLHSETKKFKAFLDTYSAVNKIHCKASCAAFTYLRQPRLQIFLTFRSLVL